MFTFITDYFKKLQEKSVIVVTSKIVALAEKRTAVSENAETKEKLIRAESEWAIPMKYVWLTVKDGMVMASAGIDASNANDNSSYCLKTVLRQLAFCSINCDRNTV